MNNWDTAAAELKEELGAIDIHLIPGTNPNTTVEQIKEQVYKALKQIKGGDWEKSSNPAKTGISPVDIKEFVKQFNK